LAYGILASDATTSKGRAFFKRVETLEGFIRL